MDGDKTLIDPLKAANLLGHEGFDPDDVQHHLDHYILERGEAVIAFSDDPDDAEETWLDADDLAQVRARLRASSTNWR